MYSISNFIILQFYNFPTERGRSRFLPRGCISVCAHEGPNSGEMHIW